MTDAIALIFTFIRNIITMLSNVSFELWGYKVDLLSIFLCFIVIGMFASIWWRGARG